MRGPEPKGIQEPALRPSSLSHLPDTCDCQTAIGFNILCIPCEGQTPALQQLNFWSTYLEVQDIFRRGRGHLTYMIVCMCNSLRSSM